MPDYSDYRDPDLLNLFQKGDFSAYVAIYDRYWKILYAIADKMLRDGVLAEDIVQDVFTTFWFKGKTLDTNKTLGAYLYLMTRSRVINLMNRSKVEARYLEHLKSIDKTDAPADELYLEKELFQQIEKAISDLPEKMRRVFELSRKEYLSHREIAQQLGISEQTVKNQVTNAMRVLKENLGDKFLLFLLFF